MLTPESLLIKLKTENTPDKGRIRTVLSTSHEGYSIIKGVSDSVSGVEVNASNRRKYAERFKRRVPGGIVYVEVNAASPEAEQTLWDRVQDTVEMDRKVLNSHVEPPKPRR